ncbi:MAG: class I SAM-dependent methyltransferase [Acidimicrobiales bacterium]
MRFGGARERFVEAARSGARGRRVLEVGTGPGRDAVALVEAGLAVVGVDLSFGHAARAASRGLSITVASARRLPFATGSIGAVWSMSTLMHVPGVAIESVMHEIARVVVPGGTVAIGVWGGPDTEHYVDAAVRPRRRNIDDTDDRVPSDLGSPARGWRSGVRRVRRGSGRGLCRARCAGSGR